MTYKQHAMDGLFHSFRGLNDVDHVLARIQVTYDVHTPTRVNKRVNKQTDVRQISICLFRLFNYFSILFFLLFDRFLLKCVRMVETYNKVVVDTPECVY